MARGGNGRRWVSCRGNAVNVAVNAAWFRLALLAYKLASAIKGLCLDETERTARFKRYRLLLVHLAGRMSRFQCKLRLRFCASVETELTSRTSAYFLSLG